MHKPIINLVLSLLLLSILTGCASKEISGALTNGEGQQTKNKSTNIEVYIQDYGDTGGLVLPIVDKPVTISYMVASNITNANEKPVIQEINKRTGVKLDVQCIPSASYQEKLKITLASGKFPDIFHGATLAEVNRLGAQGVLVPINHHIDKLPNFKQIYMEENPWVIKSWSNDNGDIYVWSVYGANRDVNHGFLYRKDIFDKNNIKPWTTTDEFYEALKQLKEIYPDSTPYVSKTQDAIFRDWAFGWGLSVYDYPMYYDENTKLWKYMFIQPEFKDMLDFMKRLYIEGLLDPEFLTDTLASWTAKMTQKDKAFVTYDWIGRMDMFYTQVKNQIPEYDLRYANPIGPVGKIKRLNKIQNWAIVVTNNERAEISLKLLDYLSSPSGATLITIGIEGEHFYFDDNNKPVYPGLNVEKVEITILKSEYGCWLQGMYLRADPRCTYFDFTEREQEAQDMMINGNKILDLDPILKFTDDENSTIDDLSEPLLRAGLEFSCRYVIGAYGENSWFEWLKEAEMLKYKQLEQIYQASQRRYDSSD